MYSRRLLAVIALLAALPLGAAAPYLVKDINQGVAPSSSLPNHFTTFGGVALFTTSDSYGAPIQLWRTDGTSSGTYYLAEGGWSKVLWNGKVWFLSKGYGQGEIWSTDGTVAGTQKLTFPVTTPAIAPGSLMAGPNHLYFLNGDKLWRTDGTTNGTVAVSTTSMGIWENDGHAPAVVMGQAMYFIARLGSDPIKFALYRVDASGLAEVTSVVGDTLHSPLVVGNLVYFQRTTTGGYGYPTTLWRTDGTTAGTFALMANQGITLDTYAGKILVSGTTIWFTGSAGNGRKLWKSNGTNAGTVVVASTLPGSTATDFAAFPLARLDNGTMLFRGASLTGSYPAGMWAFDGTNTTFLSNLSGGNASFDGTVGGNYAVVGAGDELWRSDGTIGGTYSLGLLRGSTGYVNWAMTAVGNKILFGAAGDYHGFELWRTEGYVSGTTLVKDISATTFASNPRNLRAFRNGALFTATSNSTESYGNNAIYDLWFSDGTEAGTTVVLEDAGWLDSLTPCGDRTFFTYNTAAAGHELWITDGTPGGTSMVTDLYPGTSIQYGTVTPNSSSPGQLTCVDSTLYFTGQGPGIGYAIWRSDGTAGGTIPIKFVGSSSSTASGLSTGLHKYGHGIVFGMATDGHGQLWRSDGTPGGTVMVHDFGLYYSVRQLLVAYPNVFLEVYNNGSNTYVRSDMTGAAPTVFETDEPFLTLRTDFDGRLVYSWSGYLVPGGGYFITDGTVAGTSCFDTELSASGAWDFAMWPLNGRLYYNKPKLYSTDGVTSSNTGAAEVRKFLANAGGRLYATGDKGSSGYTRFLETDGTPAGTTILIPDREVREAASSAGRLFIAADELYAYDLNVTPTSFSPSTVATPGGQTVTISGRGFVGPVTVTVGSSAAVVGTVTPTSIAFTAPQHEPGAYEIKLTLGDGRRITLEQPLVYSCTAPTAVMGPTPAAVCPLTPVTLSGSGGTRCAWFPSTGLDDPSSCTPKATLTSTTTYSLMVFNAEGCPSANYPTVTVTVNPLPDPAITISGPVSYYYDLSPNTVYTASVPDAGPGATYSWSGEAITVTAGANERTMTFRTSCAAPKVQVTVTNANGCSASSSQSRSLSKPSVTSFTPGVATPGMTVTVTGSGFGCAAAVHLYTVSNVRKVLPFTPVSDTTLRFVYPPDLVQSVYVRVNGSGGEGAYPQSSRLYRSQHKDFGRNAAADVFWWNSTTGETSIWSMAYTSFSGVRSLTVPTSWAPAVFGDFNGDTGSDMFWRNPTTGETSIWLMNGASVTTSVRSITVPTTWLPVGTGDFDGNGKSDIFWHNAGTGETSIWFMNGTSAMTFRSVTAPAGFKPAVFGDFNVDGKSDIFWRNQSTGATLFWLMNGLNPSTKTAGLDLDSSWSVAGGGDFNADAKTDIFWRNTTTGDTAMWFVSGTAVGGSMSQRLALTFTVSSLGDYSYDGTSDVFWHNRTTGETLIWLMNGSSVAQSKASLTIDPKWRPIL